MRSAGSAQRGYLYQGAKPVHWCMDCRSALAEAEVEYEDRTSPAIDVAFKVADNKALAQALRFTHIYEPVFAVIWTTTPWTLPANQAVAVHPEFDYVLVRFSAGLFILGKELADEVHGGLPGQRIARSSRSSRARTSKTCCSQHPFYDRQVPVVLGEHVTLDAGTGLVHTAPAHGLDDFVIGSRYGLPVDNPVDDDGVFFAKMPLVGGLSVWKANDVVIKALEDKQRLIRIETVRHSYPHCWRHKTPIIFRATRQWFIGMEAGQRTDAARNRQGRGRRDRVLSVRGPGAARGDDQQPARLVRVPPAQLGHADGFFRAQGNRRTASAHRRVAGASGAARGEGRHRRLVLAGAGGIARRRRGNLPESARHARRLVRFRHDALSACSSGARN